MFALSGDMLSELSFLATELRRVCPDQQLRFTGHEHLTPAERDILAAIREHVDAVLSYVGVGNYYVELIDNRLEPQKQLIKDLAAIAKAYDLPIVATADAHYLDASFVTAQSVFVAIKSGLTDKELRGRNKQARLHLLSNEEFLETYKDYP
jgi:DNA polymerase-3 subunit alpha